MHYRPNGGVVGTDVPIITHLGQLIDVLTTACQTAGARTAEQS
jgi:hypothetical protein